MTRRRRPRTAQERVVGVLGAVAPGSLGGRIRNTRPATVVQPNTGGPPAAGFDPNETPIIIGLNATAGSGSSPDNVSAGSPHAVVIGDGATGSADHTIAIGEGPTASSPHAIVIGQESTAAGFYSIAVGTFVYAAGQDSIAMGRSAEVDEDDGIAIGRRSWVQTGHTQSAAFGYNAQTSKPYQIMLGAATGTSGTPYFVEIAGSGLVLKDTATGTRYLVQITSGALVLNTAP